MAGGGSLGNVDLIYVPGPSAVLLFATGVVAAMVRERQRRLSAVAG